MALEAFSHICLATNGRSCSRYSHAAKGFVETWVKEGLEQKPAPHYKIAYNFPNSYSIKYAPNHVQLATVYSLLDVVLTEKWLLRYNLVWQKLLNCEANPPLQRALHVTAYASHAIHVILTALFC